MTKAKRRKRQWNVLIPLMFSRLLTYILLIAFAILFLFPFYSMFVGSFMADSDLFSRSPNLWPKHGFDMTSYRELFSTVGYARPLFNTFYVAIVQTVGVLFFSALAGYTFAKRRFPGREKLFAAMLLTMLMPTQATLIPWYLLMVKHLRWGDTYWPFWIPAWASAFGIFWMRQYINSAVPDELLDSAAIDGCSPFSAFTRVVLPVVSPGLSVLGVLTFVAASNQFLGPLLILTSPDKITAPLVLANFMGTTIIAPRYSMMFAGSTLATLPLIIVFFLFQRQLIEGIMSGAIKG